MIKQNLKPFYWTAGSWLIFGVLALVLIPGGMNSALAAKWFLGLWIVSLLDLFALERAVEAATGLMSEASENRGALVIRAFYWGAIKLACMGILGWIVIHASNAPVRALLLGLGTLVAVPLFGGFMWSQKELRHA